jgi:hypothetical protein
MRFPRRSSLSTDGIADPIVPLIRVVLSSGMDVEADGAHDVPSGGR